MSVEMKSSMRTKTAVSGLAAALLLMAVTACGGGGGGLATTGGGRPGTPVPQLPIPPPDPPPTDLQVHASDYASDPEYRQNWGLGQIDAATAYARIAQRDGAETAPGAGARVAVIDTGIDLGHWEFNTGRITRTNPAVADTVPTHGTAVASVIAAQRNGRDVPYRFTDNDFHGVAWGVERLEVMSIALASVDPGEPYRSTGLQSLGTIVERLADQVSGLSETDFVNLSFAHRGLIENYVGASLGSPYAAAVETLAQANAGPDNGKTILILAAGNAHGRKCAASEPNCVNGEIVASSPELYAGLPVLEASLRNHVVAAVATDRNGRIASFSNRCGIAAKWCIGAPGDKVPVAYYGPHPQNDSRLVRGYGTSSGTSIAAPFVTGGLAVLKHWFRGQLKNEALLARLYETARVTPDAVPAGRTCPAHLDLDGDLSDCELSSTLGRGLMNLGAAAAPVGTMSFALGLIYQFTQRGGKALIWKNYTPS
ncbi:MAG: S8 family serine peptidase [Alphaproteobacteria bacterium]|nr:S8 family serine peptidase [Alphaproteobacteria bacterium]